MTLQKTVFIAFFVLACAGAPFRAQADGKLWQFGYGPGHWEQLHEFQPYIEPSKGTQNQQWNDDPWSPSTWSQQRGDGNKQVVSDLFKADIFREQYVKNGVPAVDVGPHFYDLSGNDQRRVAAMLDDYYGITANKVFGMYKLYDWNTGLPIGTYTQYGLQLK